MGVSLRVTVRFAIFEFRLTDVVVTEFDCFEALIYAVFRIQAYYAWNSSIAPIRALTALVAVRTDASILHLPLPPASTAR